LKLDAKSHEISAIPKVREMLEMLAGLKDQTRHSSLLLHLNPVRSPNRVMFGFTLPIDLQAMT
jgi:trimethylamine:corrinoid methyltransferase-like protein